MATVTLEIEEAWELMSFVVNRMLDEAPIDKSDRAKVRRWKTKELRLGDEEMKALHEKMNADLARLWEVRRRGEIQRPDWR